MNNNFQRFKTFANTPKSAKKSASSNNNNQQNFQSFTSELSSQIPKKSFPKQKAALELSLMNSNVSLPSEGFWKDIPLQLLTCQVKVTEEILSLREDKLTLMEEYNKMLGARFELEREIARLNKRPLEEGERQSSSIQFGGEMWLTTEAKQSPKETLHSDPHPVVMKNEALKQQYQKLTKEKKGSQTDLLGKQHLETEISEIEDLKEATEQIQNELRKMDQRVEEINEQRFQTFFPNQSNENQNTLRQKLNSLQQQKVYLYKSLINRNLESEVSEILYELVEDNDALHKKSDSLLWRKNIQPGSVKSLKRRMDEEEKSKREFFEDLKKFKENMVELRKQNNILKRRSH